jgi:hypothetical protein
MRHNLEKRAATAAKPEQNELRWIADAYEQAQRVRVQTGERIRAVIQARDSGWGVEIPAGVDAGELLRLIRSGSSDGPIPLLGRTYRRHWEAERELVRAMEQALSRHPAWPWLAGVKGVGATLAAKLLARLDVRRAETPSAFWAFCGLATVPGVEYRCDVCGCSASYPEHYRVTGSHLRLGGKQQCSGELRRSRGPGDGVRVAQPRSAKGQRSAYDQYAKKVCYLVGTSFLKAGGGYAEHYRRERAKLARERPGWAPGRRHLTALRKTEKLFLAHLWLVWRSAVGLPVTEPYAARNGSQVIDPWSMVDPAAVAPTEPAEESASSNGRSAFRAGEPRKPRAAAGGR